MRLEYRLDDDHQYPALWNYMNVSPAEAVARMSCEFFVKEGETYVVTATAMDPDGSAVIYIKKERFTNDSTEIHYPHIGFEIRELNRSGSNLIEHKDVWDHEGVLPALHSEYIYIQRNGKFAEFAMDSREIDEDRKCYVYYGNFTGKSR
ncbi:hypothetical protein PH210_15305 [Paenibacillus sp. BSR1-1]|uniref:hypothetical protein n=1 Tax=Paenibacillus sp. BSR1-1 TaxID=3020845 RepID=UPI0025B07B22|nr:hypothetical protein [Paenibacillus sp. BSR1-1]MDN3017565.1 hypothetical protein [Paenibacillus sp. BSR1-1]